MGTPESIAAPEQVLLDLNADGRGPAFHVVGPSAVSDDGNWLAYTTDNVGFRQYKLHISDLRTGKDLPDTRRACRPRSLGPLTTRRSSIPSRTKYRSVLTVCIATRPEPTRRKDPLLYEEADERFNIGVDRTRSREFVMLTAYSHIATEMRFLPAAQPESAVDG